MATPGGSGEHLVVLVGDSGFARPLGVAIHSAASRTPIDLQFLVVDCGFTREDREHLSACAPNVAFVELDAELLAGMPLGEFGPSLFPRLFIDGLVPPTCRRALYLDGDILVRASIEPLLSLDLEGQTIAAAPIVLGGIPYTIGGAGSEGWEPLPWREHGVPAAALMFNAGVMVIDVERWRERSVSERVRQLAQTVVANDQVYANMALWSEWLPLDRRWNGKAKDAFLVHFAGPRKPWRPDYFRNRFKLEYVEAARQSGWPIALQSYEQLEIRGRELAWSLVPSRLRRTGEW